MANALLHRRVPAVLKTTPLLLLPCLQRLNMYATGALTCMSAVNLHVLPHCAAPSSCDMTRMKAQGAAPAPLMCAALVSCHACLNHASVRCAGRSAFLVSRASQVPALAARRSAVPAARNLHSAIFAQVGPALFGFVSDAGALPTSLSAATKECWYRAPVILFPSCMRWHGSARRNGGVLSRQIRCISVIRPLRLIQMSKANPVTFAIAPGSLVVAIQWQGSCVIHPFINDFGSRYSGTR